MGFPLAAKTPTSTTISVSSNPVELGQALTIGATVIPNTVTGNVTYYDGAQVLGAAPVSGGKASFFVTTLPAGLHSLSARYDGDASDTSSVSASAPCSVAAKPAAVLVGKTAYSLPELAAVVVSGDFNLDGKADLAIGDYMGEKISILLGNGDGTFQPSVSYTVSVMPSVIFIDDFNNDGKPDLLASLYGGQAFDLLLGNGDGTFHELPVSLSAFGSYPGKVADFNGDGIADIAIGWSSGGVQVALGNGDGTFQTPVLSGTGYFLSLLSGDFNGDGKFDVLGAVSSGQLGVFLGNGDGTFQPGFVSYPSTGGATMVADLNADGKLDVVIVPNAGSTDPVQVMLGNGEGTFQSPTSSTSGVAIYSNALGDFNGDGKLDILAVTSTGSLSVLYGKGDGTFLQAIPLYLGNGIGAVGVGEFNGDGITDAAYVSSFEVNILLGYLASSVSISSSANPGTAGQSLTLSATVMPPPASGTVTFLDGTTVLGTAIVIDGAGSVSGLVLSAGAHTLTASYGGDASFEPNVSSPLIETITGAASTITISVSPNPATYGKAVTLSATVSAPGGTVTFYDEFSELGVAPVVNGAASLSTLLSNAGINGLSARYSGNGLVGPSVSPTVQEAVTAVAGDHFTLGSVPITGSQMIAAADFNNDGKEDFVFLGGIVNQLSVALGDGDGTFGAPTTTESSPSVFVTTGDLNGDGKQDLLLLNNQNNTVAVQLGNGDGTFGAAVIYPGVIGAVVARVADLNGDGKADVAVAGATGLWILYGVGDGSLGTPVAVDSTLNANYVEVLDANGDGTPDLAVSSSAGLGIFLGHENGTYAPGVFYLDSQVLQIAVGDLNGDGKPDLVVGTIFGGDPTWVLLGNGDGTFRLLPTALAAAGGVSISDFNGDGKPDLVLAFLGPPPAIALGNGDGTFQVPVSLAPAQQDIFMRTVVADFNGDGRPDIAWPGGIYLGAGPACVLSATPAALYYDANGGAQTVTVSTNDPACAYGVAVTGASLQTGQTGSGTGTTPFLVTASINSRGISESGTFQVGNVTVPIIQDATIQVFDDVPPSAYYFDAVNYLQQKGITAGCSPTDFCPTVNVTRAAMAIFIVRGMLGGDDFTYSSTPYFNDVPAESFGFQWIQKLFELGITSGCGNNDFCPNDVLTRDQAAIFLTRARYGSATQFDFPSLPYFTDVPANGFAFPWIQRMKEDSITAGCAPSLYCPESPVTRGDMALFVMRGLFNQFLPANTPVIARVVPATISNGTSTTATITGLGTDFIQGITVVNPVTGLTFGPVTVASPTTLSVTVTAAAPGVTPQPASIWVTTGSQEAVLPNQLSIQ